MANIAAVQTAVPQYRYSSGDLLDVAQRWLGADRENQELFARFLRASKTEYRHFAAPLPQIVSLNGTAERSALFEKEGAALAAQCQQAVLRAAGAAPTSIDSVVFTSCTSPVLPSIDAALGQRLGLAPTVRRIPMYQHGCAGGVIALSLASRLAAMGDTVLVTAVELCSLVFYAGDRSGGQLVGSALFADGAAAALVTPSTSGISVVGSQSMLLTDTHHLLGYDIYDDGAHLRLDADLPRVLAAEIPAIVHDFLAQHGLTPAEVPFWLFHPGGMKILNFLDESFSLSWEQSRWAREVLTAVGNVSSASVFFVLKRFIESGVYRVGDYALMLGMGPGVTIELVLFRIAAAGEE